MIFAFQSHLPHAHPLQYAKLLHSNALDSTLREKDGELPLEWNNLRLLIAAVILVTVWMGVGVSRGLILYVVAFYERRRKDLLVVTITEARIQNDVRHQFHPVQDSTTLLARHWSIARPW